MNLSLQKFLKDQQQVLALTAIGHILLMLPVAMCGVLSL